MLFFRLFLNRITKLPTTLDLIKNRDAVQSKRIGLRLICVQTITNGRKNMYYTNINDYEQLLNTNKIQPSDNRAALAIVIGLITTLLLVA